MRQSDQRQSHDQLLAVIRGVRRRWRLRILLRGLAATGAVALAAYLGAALVTGGLDARAADAVELALAAVVAVAAVVFLVRPLLRRVSDRTIALYLEEHEPSLEAAVLSALEAPAGSGGAGAVRSNPLLLHTLESAIRRCHAVEDGRYIEQRSLVRVGAALGAVVVAGALVGFLGPGRAVGPSTGSASGAASLLVTPGTATVSRGADVAISALLRGFDAELVELAVRAAGDSAFDRLPMAAGPDGRFGYLLFDLDTDTDYYVEAGSVRAGPFTLSVAELPYVDRLDLELVFPRYTGLPSRSVEDGGDVAALRGTTVRVTVTPTLPVESGRIVVEGQAPVALTSDSAGGTLTGAFQVRSDGFYRIELAAATGDLVEASPRYVIDALSDGEPLVAFEEPARDARATAIEEVFVEARAEDDYGVARLTLHYAVNGGEERTAGLYGGRAGLKEVSAGHTFYLEEYGLEPGDLVAYWATAADVGQGHEATTDIYFIQVRPFSRDYSAAEQRGQPGGPQPEAGPDGDLSGRQRQIIAGTFNLVRDRDAYDAREFAEHLNTLGLSQERLAEQTRTLAQRMVARRVTRDTTFRRIAEILPEAAEAMDSALGRLRAAEPADALAPERTALQQLLRAEALFREIQISLGQNEGGGGGATPNAEDLADLFELEMDKLRDQYETVDRGGAQPADSTSAELDATAERLEELARRQQRETERRRREAADGRGTAGGQAQRELAEEVEEEARRLERLSRERGRPELGDAARRLREAAESMRRSAAGGGAGEDATDRLRDARRLLDRSRTGELRDRAAEAEREAERLAREQEEIRRESEELLGEDPGEERNGRLRRLDARKRQQQEDVAGLEGDLRELAGEAAGGDPEAARQLREAAGEISERRLEEKIDFSRQLRRGAAPDRYVRELERQIEEDLDQVRDRLAGVAGEFRDREGEAAAERTLEEARDLARGLESMRQRTGEARERASGSPDGSAGLSPGAARQQRSEARRRLEDAEALRRQLREQGLDADGLDAVMEGLRQLAREESYGDIEGLSRLQEAVADRAKRLELGLRVRLMGEDALKGYLAGNPDVSPEYRAMIEEYFRSLSRGGGPR